MLISEKKCDFFHYSLIAPEHDHSFHYVNRLRRHQNQFACYRGLGRHYHYYINRRMCRAGGLPRTHIWRFYMVPWSHMNIWSIQAQREVPEQHLTAKLRVVMSLMHHLGSNRTLWRQQMEDWLIRPISKLQPEYEPDSHSLWKPVS